MKVLKDNELKGLKLDSEETKDDGEAFSGENFDSMF